MAQLPSWRSLDTGVPVPNGAGPGRIVALVASEGAVEGGWAGGAALALARSWGEAGEKVIVVDGALHYPTLHTNAETDNFEGLSDAALFGLSVGRVAKRMDGGAYFLITAGTAVADANTVARSPRWGALLGGFLEAGVKLLLFVRDGDSGCAAFLGSASDIVVLAEKSEGPPAVVRDLEGMVRAVVGPAEVAVVTASTPSPAPAPPPPEVGRPEVGRPEVGRPEVGRPEVGPPEVGRPEVGPPEVGPPEVGPPEVRSPGVRPPEEWTVAGPGGRRRLTVLAVLVVLLLLVLLAIFGVIPTPGPRLEPVGAIPPLPPGSFSVLG